MPAKPTKPCAGCGVAVRTKRCLACERAYQAADRERRGSSYQRGYDVRHQVWRGVILSRNPVCVMCLERNVVTPAVVADHIKPLNQGGDWSLENGQGLCLSHHNAKAGVERHG